MQCESLTSFLGDPISSLNPNKFLARPVNPLSLGAWALSYTKLHALCII